MSAKINSFNQENGRINRVIFLIPSLGGGGAEKTASILIPVLAREFFLKTVLLSNEQVHKLPQGLEVVAISPRTNSSLRHILRIPLQVSRLARMVRRLQIDSVLSFMEQANIINVLASGFTGHRCFLSQRTNPLKQYEYKGLLGKLIMVASSRTYKRADKIICVSEEICTILAHTYGIDPCRLCFIPNPIDTSPIKVESIASTKAPPPFILQVGRLNIAAKGQDLTLHAFKNLLREVPRLNLVFAGDGPDAAKLREMAKRLGIMKKVFFMGWTSEPRALMLRANMLVHPSRYEGWPNVLPEALSCQCPVVAADCRTGPREILQNGKCGLLVPPDNPEALTKAMLKIYRNGDLQERLKSAGLARARDFMPEKIGKRYAKVLKG